jgi:hypothetical protein
MGLNGNRAAMLTGMARPFPAGVLAAVLKTGPPGPLNWYPIRDGRILVLNSADFSVLKTRYRPYQRQMVIISYDI